MNISPSLNIHDVIGLDSSSNPTDLQRIASSPCSPSSSSSSSTSSSNIPRSFPHLSAESITSNLKFCKKDWIIVDKKDKKSGCWKCFGIPARKLDGKKNEIYDKFVSCKHCYVTYTYSSSTRNMNKHMQIYDGFNPNQTHFITSTGINPLQLIKKSTSSSSSNKNLASHKQKMANLLNEWICSNIRPLSIVEDTGFKKIIEEAALIGYNCGPIKAESILSSRQTVSRQIKSNASIGREKIQHVLLKAARERCLVYHPTFAHRVNNVLERLFFQSEKKKKKKKNQQLIDEVREEDEDEKMSDSEQSGEDNDDNPMDLQQRPPTNQRRQHHQQKTINATLYIVSGKVNHLTILKSEIPPGPKRVITLIVSVKQLVKYVKLINLNQALEDKKSPRLVQSTVVRWLSMSNCLEALLRSYLPLNEIFDERQLDKKRLENINIFLLEKIIEFLKPWKHISKRLQTTNIPSIHVVIPGIESVKASLEWMSNDTKLSNEREIDNYLKFGTDKFNESCYSNSSLCDEEYNPLHFWKCNHALYPRLAKIAKRVFSVPASSAGVEREFSLAGNIITKKRSRLSPETVNDIIFQNSFEKYNQKNVQTIKQ
ncbi:unnamed protein product [Rotaria magnacalcarata]|uniref:HAT C-terminal dimerisation domain-containing protein n=4 Tax=Rotaria magnacalcarata TaxID=392030 RepID=A0A815XY83_9BILA|nr:unnamed protein product [Rotaria magnacalcarata]CAF1628560.1 unnamed protein product [Rotaria magnacalcarata]